MPLNFLRHESIFGFKTRRQQAQAIEKNYYIQRDYYRYKNLIQNQIITSGLSEAEVDAKIAAITATTTATNTGSNFEGGYNAFDVQSQTWTKCYDFGMQSAVDTNILLVHINYAIWTKTGGGTDVWAYFRLKIGTDYYPTGTFAGAPDSKFFACSAFSQNGGTSAAASAFNSTAILCAANTNNKDVELEVYLDNNTTGHISTYAYISTIKVNTAIA